MRTHSIMFRGWDPHIPASHTTTSDNGIRQCRIPTGWGRCRQYDAACRRRTDWLSRQRQQPRVRQVRCDRADFGLSEEMADEWI